MPFRWQTRPSDVFPEGYRDYTQTIMTTGIRVAQSRAQDAEAWMKANAPWQDQTGNARAGLHVEVYEAPGVIAELVFAHGDDIPYAIYLELANQGRFAIIAPTVDVWGAILMRDMQAMMNLGLVTRG